MKLFKHKSKAKINSYIPFEIKNDKILISSKNCFFKSNKTNYSNWIEENKITEKSKDGKKSKKNILIRSKSRNSPFRIKKKKKTNVKEINLFLKKKSKNLKKKKSSKILLSFEKSKFSTKPTILKSLETEYISKKKIKDIFQGKKTIYLQKQIGKQIFKSLPSSDDLFNSNPSYIFPNNYIFSKRTVLKNENGNKKKKKKNLKTKKNIMIWLILF